MNRLKLHARKLAKQLSEVGISNPLVLKSISSTPRELFLDDALIHKAYENTALPIGQGQTISQPYIVARMTELLLLNKPKKVLEVGTGSGYQTAVLSPLVEHIFTVERIKSLQIKARQRLKRLNLHNISFKYGDGWLGWKSKGPFDAIIVTAAANNIPPYLLEQLAINGCLVIPVGQEAQQLLLITRKLDGFRSKVIESVRFVPLINGELA